MYGVISGAQVCIIRKVFNQVAEEAGFSPAALLSYLKEENLIETRGRAMTCSRRINGVRTLSLIHIWPGTLFGSPATWDAT